MTRRKPRMEPVGDRARFMIEIRKMSDDRVIETIGPLSESHARKVYNDKLEKGGGATYVSRRQATAKEEEAAREAYAQVPRKRSTRGLV